MCGYGIRMTASASRAAARRAFLCVADECDDDVLLFEIDANGPTRGGGSGGSGIRKFAAGGASGPRMTERKGGGRYA